MIYPTARFTAEKMRVKHAMDVAFGLSWGVIAGIQNTLRAKFVRHLGVHEEVATVASI